MAQFLSPIINEQQIDANGDPLSGGTIEIYVAGTSTPAASTSDKAGLIPNSWPLTLDTLGLNTQGAVWLTGGSAYKFVIKDSDGVTLRTIDYIAGVNDTSISVDQWVLYQSAPTFLSATSFSVVGDQTQTFQVGRRLKTQNTGGVVYSTVINSYYGTPNTVVTVQNESGVLDSGLSQASYGLTSAGSETSLPGGIPIYGQCRLVKSGANLLLQPFQGNRLTINRSICIIPSAGITLAPVAAGTSYYIYAYMSSSGMALEASVTIPAVDANTGMKIKTGDVTRTLVGFARPATGPVWADTETKRLVLSWFNQRQASMVFNSALTFSTSSAAYVNINTFENLEFLTWGEQPIKVWTKIGISHTALNGVIDTGVGLDAFNTSNMNKNDSWQAYANNANGTASYADQWPATEGYHFLTLSGKTSGVQASWNSGGSFHATVWI